MPPLIIVDGLSYSYPQSDGTVLDDVSFKAQSGEFILLAGASGAGKSTLLRCLNGLVPHFSGGIISGSVAVNGIDVIAAGPQVMSQEVGIVFQDPESQTVLDTVESELAFGLENLGLAHKELVNRLEAVLDLLDLRRLRSRAVTDLSGGERQRVAIASAMIQQPKLLVLDEPTSQLDPDNARHILAHLGKLKERLGLTIILVEQRLERVTRFADRLMFLEKGRLLADGPLRQVMEQLPYEQRPPLSRLANTLHWQPVPLSSIEGRKMAPEVVHNLHPQAATRAGGNGQKPLAHPVLEARRISYSYGKQVALRNVDISLASSESVALIGPNGSGKSTLLKCLVGLMDPTEGDILLNGQTTAHKSVAEICRQIAYLPQTPDDLLFAETVRDELVATLKNHDIVPQQWSVSPDDLLEELGLAPYAAAYPRDLSVGQRQRVALGAVMITRPQLLLLDEPTRGLDYAAKQKLTDLWEKWRNDGMGILLVTHDMELAARVADRVIVLSEGQIVDSGTTSEVLGTKTLYGTQMARLFPDSGLLTVHEALDELDTQMQAE